MGTEAKITDGAPATDVVIDEETAARYVRHITEAGVAIQGLPGIEATREEYRFVVSENDQPDFNVVNDLDAVLTGFGNQSQTDFERNPLHLLYRVNEGKTYLGGAGRIPGTSIPFVFTLMFDSTTMGEEFADWVHQRPNVALHSVFTRILAFGGTGENPLSRLQIDPFGSHFNEVRSKNMKFKDVRQTNPAP